MSKAPSIDSVLSSELTPALLMKILALRAEVFVVEQKICYNDIADGIDLAPGTVHWMVFEHDENQAARDGTLVSYMRVYDYQDGTRKVGRVATAKQHRGQGHAAALLKRVIETTTHPLVMSAQAYLVDYYARFGFRQVGETYKEEDIDHVWMKLAD